MFKALYLQRHKLIMFDTLDLVPGYCLSSFIMTVISLMTFLIHFIVLFSHVLRKFFICKQCYLSKFSLQLQELLIG